MKYTDEHGRVWLNVVNTPCVKCGLFMHNAWAIDGECANCVLGPVVVVERTVPWNVVERTVRYCPKCPRDMCGAPRQLMLDNGTKCHGCGTVVLS
jgi:hypothetical protein